MAIFPIRTHGDPVLNTPTTVVEVFDERLAKLIDDMIETMYDAPGVGLAAPQIGVTKRLFVYDAQDGQGPRVIANPELTVLDGEWEYREGCLSVPGLFFPIIRPNHVKVVAQDRNGDRIEIEAEEFHARVLQHETDHLDGKLLLARLDKPQRKEAMRILRERTLGTI